MRAAPLRGMSVEKPATLRKHVEAAGWMHVGAAAMWLGFTAAVLEWTRSIPADACDCQYPPSGFVFGFGGTSLALASMATAWTAVLHSACAWRRAVSPMAQLRDATLALLMAVPLLGAPRLRRLVAELEEEVVDELAWRWRGSSFGNTAMWTEVIAVGVMVLVSVLAHGGDSALVQWVYATSMVLGVGAVLVMRALVHLRLVPLLRALQRRRDPPVVRGSRHLPVAGGGVYEEL
ncbi:MAG: hypothetical protein AB2A00_29435 [Myxococcota bacterium]